MHFLVTGTLRLPAGSVVGLSDAQAATRTHALEPLPKRKGWYTATGDLCFKVGEAIQHEGDLPKSLADVVEAPKRSGKPAGGDKSPAPAGKPAGGADGSDTAAGGDDTSSGGDQ